tara:strand:- start:3717 stop:4124 length:408 start_codon:yes stop_codon:yes gene_type:complete
MKVFRIEDSFECGPYCRSHIITHNIYAIRSAKIRPAPWNDGILYYSDKHHFGFQNLEDLKRWFTQKDRKSFQQNKYRICVYEVKEKHVIVGNKQVAFIKNKSKRKEILDPLTFELKKKIENVRKKRRKFEDEIPF